MPGDLTSVKFALSAGADTCAQTAGSAARHATQTKETFQQLKGHLDDADAMINQLVMMKSNLTEARQRVIMATQGHQVQTPTDALHYMDQALNKMDEAITAHKIEKARIEEAMIELTNAGNRAEETIVLVNTAKAKLDQYRTSF